MKPRPAIVLFLIVLTIAPVAAWADYWVVMPDAAVRHGLNRRQGPFATREAAEDYVRSSGLSGCTIEGSANAAPSDSGESLGAQLGQAILDAARAQKQAKERERAAAAAAMVKAETERGFKALDQQDPASALQHFQKALAVYPSDPTLKKNVADANAAVAAQNIRRYEAELREKDEQANGGIRNVIGDLSRTFSVAPTDTTLDFQGGAPEPAAALDFFTGQSASAPPSTSSSSGAVLPPDTDPEEARILAPYEAAATELKWTDEEKGRLHASLRSLGMDRDPASPEEMQAAWAAVRARTPDAELLRAAGADGHPLAPSSGVQSRYSDCAVFALANAANLPYGVVAARAGELIRNGTWRNATDRADPLVAIESLGLTGGEVVMLAEAFGRAEIVRSRDFASVLASGSPIMVNADDHEVVLTKAFSYRGSLWFEMMDSHLQRQERRYVQQSEIETLIRENGVAFRADPGTNVPLLRSPGRP